MTILFILMLSVLAGTLLRRFRIVRHLGSTATLTVWLLIFVFGISLGSNEEIVNDFAHLGLTAVFVALMGVAGSVLAAWALKSVIDKNGNK